MARRKKHFPCGHKGYGSYCHKCHDDIKAKHEKECQRQQKRAITRSHKLNDLIPLTHLPEHVQTKARALIQKIYDGKPGDPDLYGGERLKWDRQMIRWEVDYRYRLVGRENGNGFIELLEVVTTETFNVKYHKGNAR